MHPLWQQSKLREFCAEKGIHVSAKGVMWGCNAVFEDEVINKIAQSTGKSIAQVTKLLI